MIEIEGKQVIAGVPVANKHGIPYNPLPTMRPEPCENCQGFTWIGPKQLEMRKNTPSIFLCAECVVELLKENKNLVPTLRNLE